MQQDKNHGKIIPIAETLLALNVSNAPLHAPTHVSVGSFTTESIYPPQGQVMKLNMLNLPDDQAEPDKAPAPPLFGEHIREGIAVVKDWMKKP